MAEKAEVECVVEYAGETEVAVRAEQMAAIGIERSTLVEYNHFDSRSKKTSLELPVRALSDQGETSNLGIDFGMSCIYSLSAST